MSRSHLALSQRLVRPSGRCPPRGARSANGVVPELVKRLRAEQVGERELGEAPGLELAGLDRDSVRDRGQPRREHGLEQEQVLVLDLLQRARPLALEQRLNLRPRALLLHGRDRRGRERFEDPLHLRLPRRALLGARG